MKKEKRIKQLNPPITATELMLRMAQEEREKLCNWLNNKENIAGKEIVIEISHWQGGELGRFICEIKRWERNK